MTPIDLAVLKNNLRHRIASAILAGRGVYEPFRPAVMITDRTLKAEVEAIMKELELPGEFVLIPRVEYDNLQGCKDALSRTADMLIDLKPTPREGAHIFRVEGVEHSGPVVDWLVGAFLPALVRFGETIKKGRLS